MSYPDKKKTSILPTINVDCFWFCFVLFRCCVPIFSLLSYVFQCCLLCLFKFYFCHFNNFSYFKINSQYYFSFSFLNSNISWIFSHLSLSRKMIFFFFFCSIIVHFRKKNTNTYKNIERKKNIERYERTCSYYVEKVLLKLVAH